MKLLLMFYEKKQLNTVLVNKGGGVVIKEGYVCQLVKKMSEIRKKILLLPRE